MIFDKNCISNQINKHAADPLHKHCRCLKSMYGGSRNKKNEVEEDVTEPFATMLRGLSRAERVLLIAKLSSNVI